MCYGPGRRLDGHREPAEGVGRRKLVDAREADTRPWRCTLRKHRSQSDSRVAADKAPTARRLAAAAACMTQRVHRWLLQDKYVDGQGKQMAHDLLASASDSMRASMMHCVGIKRYLEGLMR